jgi:aspartate racemase
MWHHSRMKTIGLIGGMSWESSLEYYRLINQAIRQKMGHQHSAKIILSSVDFEEIHVLQRTGNWEESGRFLSDHAKKIENAGADFIAVCTNTMHKVAPKIQESIKIPLIHIVDTLANAALRSGVTRVGLLGTQFTMEDGFYSERLASKRVQVILPEKSERQFVHRTIYEELCQGHLVEESRQTYLKIINSLARQGAQAVVLGCTEIGLLVKPEHTEVPLFDTTRVHVDEIVNVAMASL